MWLLHLYLQTISNLTYSLFWWVPWQRLPSRFAWDDYLVVFGVFFLVGIPLIGCALLTVLDSILK